MRGFGKVVVVLRVMMVMGEGNGKDTRRHMFLQVTLHSPSSSADRVYIPQLVHCYAMAGRVSADGAMLVPFFHVTNTTYF